MRKALAVIAVLTTYATAANAQSAVEIYGVVDMGLQHLNDAGDGSLTRLNSGNLSGSRIGFRGSEDLGGGLRAIFVLENGFAGDTGGLLQGSRLFGRQSYVGLVSKTAGSLTVGRQYPSYSVPIGSATAGLQYGTTLMVHPLDLDTTSGSTRLNNVIGYESPIFSGFQYRLQYAFGESAADSNENSAWAASTHYKTGPWNLNLGYSEFKRPGSATNQNGALVGDYLATFPAWLRRIDANESGLATPTAAAVSVDEHRILAASATYSFGSVNVGAVATRTELAGMRITGGRTAGLNSGNAKFVQNVLELNADYRLNDANKLGVMLTRAEADLNTGARVRDFGWWQLGVANLHTLSKRTDLYMAASYEVADGANNSSVLGQLPSEGKNQFGVALGIRHRF